MLTITLCVTSCKEAAVKKDYQAFCSDGLYAVGIKKFYMVKMSFLGTIFIL